MITYVVGDIFRSPAAVLVNTVNTKGVMGKGLAKDFKALYPEMFRRYQQLCENGSLDVGKLFLHRGAGKWVLNFPTKKDWKHPSKVEYIEAGLKAFVDGYARNSITSIAFPQLGCGHGELNWAAQVQPLMEHYLSKVPIPVFIHLYRADAFPKEHKDLTGMREWLHSEPESLGFHEVWNDILTLMKQKQPFHIATRSGSVQVEEKSIDGENGLAFSGTRSFFLSHDVLLEMWQHFRAMGFLFPDSLTEGLAEFGDEIVALLSLLPYVSITEVSRGKPNAEFTKALQLMPRPSQRGEVFELNTRVPAHA